MKKIISSILLFSTGAAIGGACGYFVCKNKMEKILNEEIESIKKTYSCNNTILEKEDDKSNEDPVPETIFSENDFYNVFMKINEYNDEQISDLNNKLIKEPIKNNLEAYKDIIQENYYNEPEESYDDIVYVNPEDEDEFDRDFAEELTLYADDILVDEYGDLVTNVYGTVGADFKNHFGDYVKNTVFVRNNLTEEFYIVYYDRRNYSDI